MHKKSDEIVYFKKPTQMRTIRFACTGDYAKNMLYKKASEFSRSHEKLYLVTQLDTIDSSKLR